MKANEVLRQYAGGKRDFRCVNLRGQSFKGQNLSGVDFSEADIRGTNFTNAILRSANFSYAQAGLNNYSVIGLLIISLALAALSGLASGFTSYLTVYFFQPTNLLRNPFSPGLIILAVLAIFLIILIQQGIKAAFGALAVTLIVASVVALSGALVGSIAVLGFLVGVLAVAISISVGGAKAAIITVAESLVVSGALATVGSKAMTKLLVEDSNTIFLGTELPAITLALVVPSLSGYIAWQALSGDEKFVPFQRIAITFITAASGTSFRAADLTDADFTSATLLGADLRKATITRTRWFQTQKLAYSKLEGTILIQPEVQDLVVTGQGQREFFIRLNFQGANLVGADLTHANLTGSNLSEATLQGAYLEQANLTKIQAKGTDFSGARLTGACIESWDIDSTTRLDEVICDYIYLSSKQRERRPISGKFAQGELAKLLQ